MDSLTLVTALACLSTVVLPGAAWPQAVPPARAHHQLVYHAGEGRTYLIGGSTRRDEGYHYFDDVWSWDGIQWARVDTLPFPRSSHRIVHHAQRNSLILFGGGFADAVSAEGILWEWSGSDWKAIGGNVRAGTSEPGVCYDQRRERIVVFGGWDGAGNFRGDTWEWRAAELVRVDTAGPSPRAGHALVYDPVRRNCLLFGGRGANGYHADTWEWDGVRWQQLEVRGPPARWFFGSTTDPMHGRIVLFGGRGPHAPVIGRDATGDYGDTWAWDGERWQQLPGSGPLPRSSGQLAMGDGGSILLFGGREEKSDAFHDRNDLWKLRGETWVQEGASRSFDRSIALEDSAATSASVSTGDVNADGHQDIVLVKGRHWPLENLVLLGNGNGTFQPAYRLGGPPDRSYSGVLVDMDLDGDLDVVVSNDSPDAKIVRLNDGRGRFAAGATFGRAAWPTRHISVVDLNGDGLPDVVLANRYGNKPGPSYVCFGVKGGRFADECVAFAQGSATTIKPADVNGDGSPDLVMPHRDAGQSFIYLNDGQGGFAGRRPFGPPAASIRSAEPIDLDADGAIDLVAIDEETGPAIFWGRADGTYSAAEPLGTGEATPYAIVVADLDRNGRPDVIVGYVESRPIVYFNDGLRAFNAAPFGDNEGTAYAFSVADFDEDGFLDIAMARSDARNMLYFGAPANAGSR